MALDAAAPPSTRPPRPRRGRPAPELLHVLGELAGLVAVHRDLNRLVLGALAVLRLALVVPEEHPAGWPALRRPAP